MKAEERVKDLAALVEMNRFVGREFFSYGSGSRRKIYETNLAPTKGEPLALWLEVELTLADDTDETRVRSGMPGATAEAKQALRRGKLLTVTRLKAPSSTMPSTHGR